MKFVSSNKDHQVSVEDFENVNLKIQFLDFTDIDKAQETFDDLQMLQSNIERYGITEPVMDLVGGTLESMQININSKEACLEGIGDKIKAAGSVIASAGKKLWEAIKAIIAKITEFIMKMFSKKRTEAVIKESIVIKDNVAQFKTTYDVAAIINITPDDKASAAGKVEEPKREESIPLAQHMQEINSLKSEIVKLEKLSAARATRVKEKLKDKQAEVDAAKQENSDLQNKLNVSLDDAEKLKNEKKAAKAALSAIKKVSEKQAVSISSIKQCNGYVKHVINERRRVINLELSYCVGLLNLAKKLNSSFERLTLNSGWSKSASALKEMAEGKLSLMIPASAIGPAATEISQAVSIMVNTTFENGDQFVEWRDNAFKGCKYLTMDGVSAIINPDATKDSTIGKLGYLKDYVLGSLNKKYEGTAAVVNKITTLINSLNSEISSLELIQAKSEDIDKVE